MRKWQVWEALKGASHFNVSVSLELALKSLLILNELEWPKGPKGHRYEVLYDKLKEKRPEMAASAEQCYDRAKSEAMHVDFVQLVTVEILPGSEPQELRVPDTPDSLREFFSYLNDEVEIQVIRYSFENVGLGEAPRHYLLDLGVVLSLVRELLHLSLKAAQQAGLRFPWPPNHRPPA